MAKSKRQGFAMLIALIAIAIMMLLYVVQMDTLFAPQAQFRQVEMEKQPWAYEHLLLETGKTVKKPKSPRLQLTEPFEIAGPAERSGQPRGDVKIAIDTDGRLTANWNCKYESEEKIHTFTAELNGNVNVKMKYEDQSGTADKSRLFFIAKGTYEHRTASADTQENASKETGEAWLIGWLRPDKTAEGFVTITTNYKWSAEFGFQAKP